MMLYALINIGCALAPNKAVLFVCRLLAGTFASSAFSNAAAVVTDLFAPKDRSNPMIITSLAPLLGPSVGPLFGAAVTSRLPWPFVFWLLGALGLVLEVALLCLPETYLPVITSRGNPQPSEKASRSFMRKVLTFCIVVLGRPVSVLSILPFHCWLLTAAAEGNRFLGNQINMMLREPIIMCATFYLSFFFALM
jgi:MFS family permease